MTESCRGQSQFIGRQSELDELKNYMEAAVGGSGCTVILHGEPGIGKTRLIEEFKAAVAERGVKSFSGNADADTHRPFILFSDALKGVAQATLFQTQEYQSFTRIFAVNGAGKMFAEAPSLENEDIDAGTITEMLSAVQDFVRDSFDAPDRPVSGLSRLEYGAMKVMIERGNRLFLAAVVKGTEHPDMKSVLRRAVLAIEKEHHISPEKCQEDENLANSVSGHLSELAALRFLVRMELEGINLENERIRISEEILSTLAAMSKESALVLFLEDLHWADESSLFVLSYLARNIRTKKILITCTSRPAEGENFKTTLMGMSEGGLVHELMLEHLSINSVSALVNNAFPENDFPPAFIENLVSKSGGNPFFIIEILWQMKEDGDISQSGGKPTLIGQNYSIPNTIEELVHKRLDCLGPEEMAMAEYTSCIGREFETGAALSIGTLPDPSSAMKNLQATGILHVTNGAAEFTHALFRDVIYNSMGGRWKAAHHKSIGEYYESVSNSEANDMLYELARHFSRSNEHSKALKYCIKAGERAEGAFAPEQAIEFYTAALSSASKARNVDGSVNNEIYERLGDAAEFAARYDNAIEYLEQAAYTSPVDLSRRTRKVANILQKQGRLEESISMAIKAAGHAPPKSHEWVMARYIEVSSRLRTGAYAEARSLMQGVLSIPALSQELLGQGLHMLGNIAWYEGEHEKARNFYLEAYEARQDTKDKRSLAKTIANLGMISSDLGDLDSAGHYAHRALEIYEGIGDRHGIAAVLADLGNIAHLKGDIDMAIDYQKRNLAICEEIGNRWGAGYALVNIASAHNDSGEPEKALDYHERALKVLEAVGDTRGVGITLARAGHTLRQLGNQQMAVAYLERGLKMLEGVGDNEGTGFALFCLAETSLEAGDTAGAASFCDRLAKTASTNDTRGQAMVMRGRILAAMGKEWRKDLEGGVALFDSDMALKADALYHQAKLLADTEPGVALKSIKEAREIIEQYRNRLWEERIVELEARLGAQQSN